MSPESYEEDCSGEVAKMAKCESCYHNKICINGVNYKDAQKCRNYKNKALIAELPCKLGDKVYIIISESEKFGGAYIKKETVTEISTAGRIWTDECYYDSDDIGEMLFLSRAEAELTLKERENNA